MGLRVLALDGWMTAESTDDRPVCAFCSWCHLQNVVIARERFEQWECHHHLTGWRGSRLCHMFRREPGADDG
jgi:hypothetical protein